METLKKEQTNTYSDLLLEIKNFYNYILDETIKLIESYGCKTPLEIYCLFNLINCFYVKENEIFNLLYLNKKHNYSQELEENDIKGIQVLLNGGVCRHKSAMLNDIYTKMNIDSVVLVGLSETFLNFHYSNSKNKQIADRIYVENMLKKISEGAKIEDFKSHLKKRKISYSAQEVHDDYFYKHFKWPNHAIVMAGKDKKYYLDPTNNITYYKDDRDIVTLKNRSGIYFFSDITINEIYWNNIFFKNQKGMETFNKIIKLPCDIESETIQIIKEIYSYLKNYKKDIEEFTKNNSNYIETIRKKCLSLPTSIQ